MRLVSLLVRGMVIASLVSLPGFAQSSPPSADDLQPNEPQPALPNIPQSSRMTLERLDAILKQEAENVQGAQGRWQFTIGDRPLLVFTDIRYDRMRIFTPIVAAEDLSDEQWQRMMSANFDTALDARYAMTEGGTIVATFVHPLSTLSDRDLRSAIYQVANLAETFGDLYSSGALEFDPDGSDEPEDNVGI
ncbi:MAG: type III secretion system chaperone [Spirulina sp. SIO3F2]|nr:type III secretion system chaperone [Spirulina sp. SIO3F2]